MPTQIPPERVPPIAKEIASTRMMWAAIIWFFCGLMTVAMVSMPDEDKDKDTDLAAKLLGGGVVIAVPFLIGLRQFRHSKRAGAATRGATEDSMTFMLEGRHLFAYDKAGVPQLNATIKLSRQNAAMLTALPKAEIRS